VIQRSTPLVERLSSRLYGRLPVAVGAGCLTGVLVATS
jgi:hypothetical protein